jgi:hypothetical protein
MATVNGMTCREDGSSEGEILAFVPECTNVWCSPFFDDEVVLHALLEV